MAEARLSAIVVNWNHGSFLPNCLGGLLADGPLELIVVDNGSTDGSPEWLASHHPEIRLIEYPDNRGFSHALNDGIRSTYAPYVLSLNPDVVVRPGFLAALVESLERADLGSGRAGMAAPKLLRADDPTLLDSTGLFVDRRRRLYDRGQGEPDRGQYDTQIDVFGPCGAAALYRREMLEDLAIEGEYLDEGFFAYCEDADLAWRAQLRGWRCVYAPAAVATHVRGWGDTLRKQGHAPKGGRHRGRGPRLALRNRYLMTIKNDAWRYTLADLPLILAAEFPRLAYAAVTSPQVLLALLDLAKAWPSALRKRGQIRSHTRVADADLRRWFVALSGPRPSAQAEDIRGC